MPLIIRISDTSTHGGVVVTGGSKSLAENQKIARISDILLCAIHGPQPIVTGSPNTLCEGQPIARHGVDIAACGAILISNASKTFVN